MLNFQCIVLVFSRTKLVSIHILFGRTLSQKRDQIGIFAKIKSRQSLHSLAELYANEQHLVQKTFYLVKVTALEYSKPSVLGNSSANRRRLAV